MKSYDLKNRRRYPGHSTRGVALVIVLACIVLLTALMVTFLGNMQSQLEVSRSDYASGRSRLLAETAINTVIGQIQKATRSASANRDAWASQPGMVRTYGSDGKLVNAYKLYSSDIMVTDSVDPAAELATLADWDKTPALFTDLNAPRNGIYPIVDPIAAVAPNAVEGFALNSPPVAGGASDANQAPMPGRWLYVLEDGTMVPGIATGSSNSKAKIPGATAINRIVGRIAFWTDDETCRVNINTAAGDVVASSTDQGSFWDVPFYDGPTERKLGSSQPANGEYQRYPGHPATVSLGTVFPTLSRTQIYALAPRIADGGTKGGTVDTASVTAARAPKSSLDDDRLYASVDELIFQPGRTQNTPLTKSDLERTRFFLTATSRAPDLTLFGTPRVSLWPVHVDLASNATSPFTTAYDRLAAFCSTYGGATPFRYYIQRRNSDSPTQDYTSIDRNRQLYGYLQNLTAMTVPGFGGNFLAKYPLPPGGGSSIASDRDQLLTEIFDYIRSTNLFDAALGGNYLVGNPSTGEATAIPAEGSFYQYTNPSRPPYYGWPGHGQAVPLAIGNTKGFGRFYSIAEVAVHIICTADGNGLGINDTGSAHDHRTVSNVAVSTLLVDSTGNKVGSNYVSKANLFGTNETLADTFGGPLTALTPGQKRLQAILLLKIYSPSLGFPTIYPDFKIRVSGLENLEIGGKYPFPTAANGSFRQFGRILAGRYTGGLGTWMLLSNTFSLEGGNANNTRYVPRWNAVATDPYVYPWVSNPFTVNGDTMSFGNPGQDITIELFAGDGTRPEGDRSLSSSDPAPDPASLVQTLKVRFPTATIPTPDLLKWAAYSSSPDSSKTARSWWGFRPRFTRFDNTTIGLQWTASDPTNLTPQGNGCFIRIDPKIAVSPWKMNESEFYKWPTEDYSQANNYNSDVVRSLIPRDGDARLIAARRVVTPDLWMPHPDYFSTTVKLAHLLESATYNEADPTTSECGPPGNFRSNKLIQGASYYSRTQIPNVPRGITSAEATGDWDNGNGPFRDGAYINMPDEGTFNSKGGAPPYYDQGQDYPVTPAQFSPNRIMPSAGMLGSLSTGVFSGKPWQTLLFRPQPGHPQSAQSRPGHPPDHLIMDLFTMPAVEPYAISEPFSTAGKINMNYQILPYTYIHRSTALRAAMGAEKIAAIPDNAGDTYKRNLPASGPWRFRINLDTKTGALRQFESRFAQGDIFRSATEICDIFLPPLGESWGADADAIAFWNTHRLTGENARERVYARLYAKLTTRSNSYQIYYRVQALQKRTSSPPDEWDESLNRITSEQRGSAIIERYLDSGDESLPDYATNIAAPSLDSRYRFRVLSRKLFDN